jgi:hypothetical protein
MWQCQTNRPGEVIEARAYRHEPSPTDTRTVSSLPKVMDRLAVDAIVGKS